MGGRGCVISVVGRILPLCQILPKTGNCQAVAKRGLAEFGRIPDLCEMFRELYIIISMRASSTFDKLTNNFEQKRQLQLWLEFPMTWMDPNFWRVRCMT